MRDVAQLKLDHPIADVVQQMGTEVPSRWLNGDDFMISCLNPAHEDRTPSCVIHTVSGRFNCFGCGAHGDVVDLVRLAGRADTFLDAVRWLEAGASKPSATRVISMHPAGDPDRPCVGRTPLSRVLAVNKAAWAISTTPERRAIAQRYLASRGIDVHSLERREGRPLAGYTVAGPSGMVGELRAAGFDDDAIVDAGWATRHDDGLTDRLRRRVVFPIRDADDHVIAYSARDASERARNKYVNTATTVAFRKRAALYVPTRTTSRHVVLCEGPVDALALANAATSRAEWADRCPVAILGTQLTTEQAALLGRMTATAITILADGDPPGRSAAAAWLARLSEAGLSAEVQSLPDGHDPASSLTARPDASQRSIGFRPLR